MLFNISEFVHKGNLCKLRKFFRDVSLNSLSKSSMNKLTGETLNKTSVSEVCNEGKLSVFVILILTFKWSHTCASKYVHDTTVGQSTLCLGTFVVIVAGGRSCYWHAVIGAGHGFLNSLYCTKHSLIHLHIWVFYINEKFLGGMQINYGKCVCFVYALLC